MSSVLISMGALLLSGGGPLPVQPAAFSQNEAEKIDRNSAEDEGEALLSRYFDQLYEGRFGDALKTLDRIPIGKDNSKGQAIIAAMRGAALSGLKRDSDAKRQFAEAERLAPHSAEITRIAFDTTLTAGRFDVAADYFDQLIARSPDVVRELDPETVWHFIRSEPKDQEQRNDDRRVALARLGYGGEEGDYLTGEAVEILVKRGDLAGANELLRYIDDPQQIENLLIQKRLSGLWTRLEGLAGPSLEKVRGASAAAAERAYAAAPEDHERLQQLANALRYAGRHDEAVALRSNLPDSSEAMAKADEEMGWAVNNVALALSEVGRADEADRLFAMLNDAPMENGRWRVSMKINRLELLVAGGKFERALALLDVTEASAKADGNEYAQQLVRRLRYCTMSGLGRKDEAARLLPDVIKHAEDAPGPTIDGLICGGELDQAEKLALTSLQKSDFEPKFVRSLQVRPLTADDPSVWSQGWEELRARPAIAREFERLGRDLPENLVPPRPPKLAGTAN